MNKKAKEILKPVIPQKALDTYHKFLKGKAQEREAEMAAKVRKVQAEVNEIRSIDLGVFLAGEEIELRNLTFMPGGSTVLDYAFLRVLAKRYGCKTYLEIGTYIGESIHNVADVCEMCHSVTAGADSPYNMRDWCRDANLPHYSNRLIVSENIIMHAVTDSKKFDYSEFFGVDLWFIDADHSYEGVLTDTRNVFGVRKEDSFVVWHDMKGGTSLAGGPLAVRDALREKFQNFYLVDNNFCGIYIPPKYQADFPLHKVCFTEDRQPLQTYDVTLYPQEPLR